MQVHVKISLCWTSSNFEHSTKVCKRSNSIHFKAYHKNLQLSANL